MSDKILVVEDGGTGLAIKRKTVDTELIDSSYAKFLAGACEFAIPL